MGILDPQPSSQLTAHPSTDGAYEAPDRTSRAHCWDARDKFFSCLDTNGIIDSIKEKDKADAACGGDEVDFRRDCASSWVTYFKQRRVMEHKKQQTLDQLTRENAQRLPEGMGPAQLQGATARK